MRMDNIKGERVNEWNWISSTWKRRAVCRSFVWIEHALCINIQLYTYTIHYYCPPVFHSTLYDSLFSFTCVVRVSILNLIRHRRCTVQIHEDNVCRIRFNCRFILYIWMFELMELPPNRFDMCMWFCLLCCYRIGFEFCFFFFFFFHCAYMAYGVRWSVLWTCLYCGHFVCS